MNQIVAAISIAVGFIILLFHGCTIYVCVTAKDLKNVRFFKLTLLLSLSDITLIMEGIYSCVLSLLTINDFQCMLTRALISGTILASLLQTLLICFEILNATFTIKRRILGILTGNVSIGLCLVIPHFFNLVRFGIEASQGLIPCETQSLFRLENLLSHDVPVYIIVMLITVLYSIVIIRLVKHHNSVQAQLQVGDLTEIQKGQKKKAARRMRRNVATLGWIISVALISALPRTVIRFYALGSIDTVEIYASIANVCAVAITPFFDPAIYLFRVKKYRQHLMTKCCFRRR